jgi:hypothetical protein
MKSIPFRNLPADVEVVEGFIVMSNWGIRSQGEVAVLHELAHAVLPSGHLHDRRWARTFTEFVGCAMGSNCRKVLVEEFRLRKIPFSPVRKASSNGQHLRGLRHAVVQS